MAEELLYFVLPLQANSAMPKADFVPGQLVEALWEGEWLPATVEKRTSKGFCILWEGEGSVTDGFRAAELRPRSKRGPEGLSVEAPPKKRAKIPSKAAPTAEKHRQLVARGFLPLADGLPWRWALFDFVEECHARFSGRIEAALEALRSTWAPERLHLGGRPGSFAAWKVSSAFARFGVAIYAGPPSQEPEGDFDDSGPRFYVSVTQRASRRFGECPSVPMELAQLLWPDEEDLRGRHRARGLGWSLAPPGSDPQQLHADLWGRPGHRRAGRVRFPHILWKRGEGSLVTTEVVPGGFTEGQAECAHYEQLESAGAPALILDGECLHRGAATPTARRSGAAGGLGWVSTCSIELCSPSGWRAWEAGTEGTEADPKDEEWEMLLLAPAVGSAEKEALQVEEAEQAKILEEQRSWARGC